VLLNFQSRPWSEFWRGRHNIGAAKMYKGAAEFSIKTKVVIECGVNQNLGLWLTPHSIKTLV
jgi:hypothetical protein